MRGDLRLKEKEVEDQKLRLQVLDKEERTMNERIRSQTEIIETRSFNIEKTNTKLEGVLRECE